MLLICDAGQNTNVNEAINNMKYIMFMRIMHE